MTERAHLIVGALAAAIILPALMAASALIDWIASSTVACEFVMCVIFTVLATATVWLAYNLEGDR